MKIIDKELIHTLACDYFRDAFSGTGKTLVDLLLAKITL